MNTLDNLKPIMVAVDGSDSALRATRWAAAEAARRGRRLLVVHAYEWPLPAYGPVFVDPTGLHDAVRTNAASIVRDAAAAARETSPDLTVETETQHGTASMVLREASQRAALLVLGSRGRGGFAGMLTGSVAVTLAAHGHCPVAVIRGDEPDPHSPVVVGVDGSAVSDLAIGIAFDEAASRGCGLLAVHAWADQIFPPGLDDPHPDVDWEAPIERAHEILAERLAGWREKYPEVRLFHTVNRDRPTQLLIEETKAAQLLVVGSRGRGGFTGLTLGSVSQAMIHHAHCPVLIARPDTNA
jgi:nucleotide-binding universal stress UspA family protein